MVGGQPLYKGRYCKGGRTGRTCWAASAHLCILGITESKQAEDGPAESLPLPRCAVCLCRVLPPSTLGVLPQSADSTAGARKIIFMHVLGLACNAAVRISIDPAACQSFGKGQLALGVGFIIWYFIMHYVGYYLARTDEDRLCHDNNLIKQK